MFGSKPEHFHHCHMCPALVLSFTSMITHCSYAAVQFYYTLYQ